MSVKVLADPGVDSVEAGGNKTAAMARTVTS